VEEEDQPQEQQGEPRVKVGLKQAVRIALDSVRELYSSQGVELTDLLLEEVEKTGNYWYVTVGFTRPNSATLGAAFAGPKRAFKRVKIDDETGEFVEMQIRTLQSSTP